ncbi:MAG TPA: hypothetical protein VIW69_14535 [Candidatus Elarobacter sp.]
MLIVTDGTRFGFGPASTVTETFTLQTMIGALNASTSPQIQVETAHRRGDPFATFTAPFNFVTSVADLRVYDEIWLIADEGPGADPGTPIGADESAKIFQFMDAGGGVFAVGDHAGIGSQMCGTLPRVRSMRLWFASAVNPVGAPANHPVSGPTRADTVQPTVNGFFFDNQSDDIPQTIAHQGAEHPILQSASGPITKFPDHMHEGETVAGWGGYDFTQTLTFNGYSAREYPTLDGAPVQPRIIAKAHVIAGHATLTEADYSGPTGGPDMSMTIAQDNGVLSVYDGFDAGVGRVVTGSTFHHYMDLNLIGDPVGSLLSGADTHHGFQFNPPGVLDGIKTFFVNMAVWLAGPKPAMTLAVDKSTFGNDEVGATPSGQFPDALFVIVDGLKPSQFPGGGIGMLGASPMVAAWAPTIPSPRAGITITATSVASDAPPLIDRFGRFTFAYEVSFTDAAATFGYPSPPDELVVPIAAALPAPGGALNASALLELVKSADPFFSNLHDGNTTSWLSSDVRVFHLNQDESLFGVGPVGATPDAARTFVNALAGTITDAQFTSLPHDEETSALSLFESTLLIPTKKIFNFALARVRLNGTSASATNARVFFRLFQSQTAAALTYEVDGSGVPLRGFRQTTGPADSQKISLLGWRDDAGELISVPCFAHIRQPDTSAANNMTHQTDPTNARPINPIPGQTVHAMFGALLDTNLPNAFLPTTFPQANLDGPFSGPLEPISGAVLRGVHQCIVAEIVYDHAPVVPGATPATSDKLAQRNLAFTVVANPGAAGSRTATHTFDVRPTPAALAAANRPDELMIDWRNVPAGSVASIYLPDVAAADVIGLASSLYATHQLDIEEPHTLRCPAAGVTYLPLPAGAGRNFAGLLSVELPAGIKKRQRFDIVVRQLTTVDAQLAATPVAVTNVSTGAKGGRVERTWRRVVGAFQIAIPVSTSGAMLIDEQRTLSVMRWIAQRVSANDRWHPVLKRYLEQLAGRVTALGGDAAAVPPTQDGTWPALVKAAEEIGAHDGTADGEHDGDHHHREHTVTGTIDRIGYDAHGILTTFVVRDRGGELRRFELHHRWWWFLLGRRRDVRRVVRFAWQRHFTVTVIAASHAPHCALEIILHHRER